MTICCKCGTYEMRTATRVWQQETSRPWQNHIWCNVSFSLWENIPFHREFPTYIQEKKIINSISCMDLSFENILQHLCHHMIPNVIGESSNSRYFTLNIWHFIGQWSPLITRHIWSLRLIFSLNFCSEWRLIYNISTSIQSKSLD